MNRWVNNYTFKIDFNRALMQGNYQNILWSLKQGCTWTQNKQVCWLGKFQFPKSPKKIRAIADIILDQSFMFSNLPVDSFIFDLDYIVGDNLDDLFSDGTLSTSFCDLYDQISKMKIANKWVVYNNLGNLVGDGQWIVDSIFLSKIDGGYVIFFIVNIYIGNDYQRMQIKMDIDQKRMFDFISSLPSLDYNLSSLQYFY